ncbi:MAG: hypothetical protein A2293_16445 [Elusimicrobia bacterium RIFOXYB2_FULL_49_7]|nr:MAG: hypothetical protein A2293_16445 [Elusimicrobia bacterium RIFOXYB2_FULL_49_7]
MNKEDAIKLAKNFEKKFNGVRDKYRDHPTLGALVRQCELLYWVMRDWVKGEYEMPWFAIAAITASLLYVISPIDFIPDFIPVIGYLDDLFIVLLCVKLIREELKKYCDQKGLDRNLYKLG